jgi:hypothetical protein
MALGFPIRLTASLATRARETAEVQDRSVTEQVEHWARLGQIVESVATAGTVERLKSVSHDPRLTQLLDAADSSRGRERAARSIAKANPVRHGTTAKEPSRIVRVETKRRGRTKA